MKGSLPTMQDVADAAGFSRTAVCFALRNDPRLSATTRQRIQRVAGQLGYRPNPLVSALMANLAAIKKRPLTATIAYVTDLASDDVFRKHAYHLAYFGGATRRAAAAGYRVEPFFFHEPDVTPKRISEILHARNVQGMLLAPRRRTYDNLDLNWDWFACVSVGVPPTGVPLHTVNNDQFHSLHFALRRLRLLGYHRTGFVISVSVDELLDRVWTASFTSFQANLCAKDRVPFLRRPEPSLKTFSAWFQRHRPEVVVSHSLQIRDWLQAMALSVPRDVGFFHIDLPPGNREVSGLNQDQALIGAAAADLVIEQLHHNERGLPAHPKRVLLRSEWVQGRTIRRQTP